MDNGFHRRDFLRLLSGGALTLASGGILTGCGGGGSSPSGGSPNPTGTQSLGTPLFSQTQQAMAAGTQIADATHGITLVVPANTVSIATPVSLQVFPNQRGGTTPSGFTSNANAVNLSIDPSAMAAGSSLQVQIPTSQAFDEFGSMMMATDDNGRYVPLEVTYDATNNVLIGSVTKEILSSLTSSAQPASQRTLHKEAFSLGALTVGIFSAVTGRSVSQAQGTFYLYDPSAGSYRLPTAQETMAGKRIAVIVHGIFNDRTNMVDLGRFLRTDINTGNNTPGPVYDAVWCYEYNWKAHIVDNATRFTQKLGAAMTGAVEVDIYAHSMGGLVSRWALEKAGLGSSITRLTTMGTPHAGVPLQALQLLLFLIGQKTGLNAADFIPGVDDLTHKKIENPLAPSFIKQLNDGTSAYQSTAEYFTLAGNNFRLIETVADVAVDVGIPIELYFNTIPFTPTTQLDGIVPTDSALSSVLATKSSTWSQHQDSHTATVLLTHDQLKGDDNPANQAELTNVLKPWAVEPLGVTIQ